jgi:hypothetical protein
MTRYEVRGPGVRKFWRWFLLPFLLPLDLILEGKIMGWVVVLLFVIWLCLVYYIKSHQ